MDNYWQGTAKRPSTNSIRGFGSMFLILSKASARTRCNSNQASLPIRQVTDYGIDDYWTLATTGWNTSNDSKRYVQREQWSWAYAWASISRTRICLSTVRDGRPRPSVLCQSPAGYYAAGEVVCANGLVIEAAARMLTAAESRPPHRGETEPIASGLGDLKAIVPFGRCSGAPSSFQQRNRELGLFDFYLIHLTQDLNAMLCHG